MSMKTTWDMIRMAAIQRCFVETDGKTIPQNEYLNNIPAAYNEAVLLISTTNRYITKYFDIESDGRNNTLLVDLNNAVEDLFLLKPNSIYLVSSNNTARVNDFKVVDASVLLLDGSIHGTYRVYYYAYPKLATMDTKGDEDMEIDPDVAALVPLYIASELYKEDDLGQAIQYRNEFEIGRELLTRERGGGSATEFVSETGWW